MPIGVGAPEVDEDDIFRQPFYFLNIPMEKYGQMVDALFQPWGGGDADSPGQPGSGTQAGLASSSSFKGKGKGGKKGKGKGCTLDKPKNRFAADLAFEMAYSIALSDP